jgi:hypothetical protein
MNPRTLLPKRRPNANPGIVQANQYLSQNVVISLHVATLSEQLKYTFVCAEHDGGTRYYAEHMWDEATVEGRHTLLFPNEAEALSEAGIFDPTVLLRRLT